MSPKTLTQDQANAIAEIVIHSQSSNLKTPEGQTVLEEILADIRRRFRFNQRELDTARERVDNQTKKERIERTLSGIARASDQLHQLFKPEDGKAKTDETDDKPQQTSYETSQAWNRKRHNELDMLEIEVGRPMKELNRLHKMLKQDVRADQPLSFMYDSDLSDLVDSAGFAKQ